MDEAHSLLDGLKNESTPTLTKAEKEQMLLSVRQFASTYRAPAGFSALIGRFFALSPVRTSALPAGLALLLGLSGTAAAQSALPGDFLYPVKIHVNETLRSVVSVTARSQAAWQIERAGRRLEEAEQLTAESRLSRDLAVAVDTRLAADVAAAKRRIAELRIAGDAAGSAATSASLDSVLHAHLSVLSQVAASQDDAVRIAVLPLLATVKTESDQSKEIADKEAAAAGESIGEAAKANARAAQEKIQAVRRTLQALPAVPDKHPLLAKLKDSESSLKSAEAKLAAGSRSEAFAVVRAALRDAEEASLLLRQGIGVSSREHSTASVSAKNTETIDVNAGIGGPPMLKPVTPASSVSSVLSSVANSEARSSLPSSQPSSAPSSASVLPLPIPKPPLTGLPLGL